MSGSVFAQIPAPDSSSSGNPFMPGMSLGAKEKRQLTPEEQEKQKQLDADYKAATKKIPDQKVTDPWGGVRPSPTVKGQSKQTSQWANTDTPPPPATMDCRGHRRSLCGEGRQRPKARVFLLWGRRRPTISRQVVQQGSLRIGCYFAEPSQSDFRTTHGGAPCPAMDWHWPMASFAAVAESFSIAKPKPMLSFHCVAVPLEEMAKHWSWKVAATSPLVLAAAFVQCKCCGISITFRKSGGPPIGWAVLCITERQHSIGEARTDPQNSKHQNHAGWLKAQLHR
jgi:hypothetical protein